MEMRDTHDQLASFVSVKTAGEESTVTVRSLQASRLGGLMPMVDTILTLTVCKTDKSCKPFKPRTPVDDGRGGQSPEDGEDQDDMVCYKGGIAVEHNYQMCDVTSMSPAS